VLTILLPRTTQLQYIEDSEPVM